MKRSNSRMPKTISETVHQYKVGKTRPTLLPIHTIYITESTGFALLGVVKATGPVDRDIAFVAVQPSRAFHTPTGANAAELKQTIEHRTIIPDVILALFLRE